MLYQRKRGENVGGHTHGIPAKSSHFSVKLAPVSSMHLNAAAVGVEGQGDRCKARNHWSVTEVSVPSLYGPEYANICNLLCQGIQREIWQEKIQLTPKTNRFE